MRCRNGEVLKSVISEMKEKGKEKNEKSWEKRIGLIERKIKIGNVIGGRKYFMRKMRILRMKIWGRRIKIEKKKLRIEKERGGMDDKDIGGKNEWKGNLEFKEIGKKKIEEEENEECDNKKIIKRENKWRKKKKWMVDKIEIKE